MNRMLLAALAAASLHAQISGLDLPINGGSQKASVSQGIGPVTVTITYSSPAVHGPSPTGDGTIIDRRGKIWGDLVPYGLTDLGFGHRQPAPWRGGANENTVFTVSEDVAINGQPLPAGSYGLHFITGPEEWTIIFSKTAGEWGSFFYDAKADALRVKAKPRKNAYREWLTYEFPVRKPEEALVELQWEELAVPWTVTVPKIKDIYLSRVRQQLHNSAGFGWQAWAAATEWCLRENMNLNEALVWSDYAINGAFVGQENFRTLSVKAQVLAKLGRGAEAAGLMDKAVHHASATPVQLHQYGRQLLNEKKPKEALAVFELNAKRFGEQWPTNVGLARGYAAAGEKARALGYARKALAQAPDPLNKAGMEALIQSLTN